MFEDIPNANEIVAYSSSSTDEQDSPVVLNKLAFIEKYSDKYIEIMLKQISNSIKDMKKHKKTSSMVLIGFHDIINDKKLRFHYVHYGPINDQDKKWTNRVEIPDDKKPFRILQNLIKEKGYYLLDESYFTKSKKAMIIIYAQKPDDYDKRP